MKGLQIVLLAFVASLLTTGHALGQCNDYQLSITGTCPGTVTLFWGGAPPGAFQGIVIGNSAGCSTPIVTGPCAGTTLCICGSVSLVGTTSTGSSGTGSISGSAGPSACGKYLQCITNFGSPCKVSNPVQIP